jgi:hypothetical protein
VFRRHLPVALAVAVCLLGASSALADPVDSGLNERKLKLFGGDTAFSLAAAAPTVQITSAPSDLTNNSAATFKFVATDAVTIECKLDTDVFEAEPCTSPKSYTGLTDGPHTFTVKATNTNGKSAEANDDWTVDTVAPTTMITQKPTHPSNDASPTFEFESSEPGTFQCKLDGVFSDCSASKTYVNVSDGVHTFSAVATDPAGNVGPEASPYTWTIDTVPPTVTLTQTPQSSTNSPTFYFNSSDAKTFTCSLDHASPTSCSSPTTYTGLGDGPHSFAVTPTDAAGNIGPAATHDWTIETRAPTAALTSGPTALSNSSSATFTFTADEPSSFDCKLDDRGFEACGSPVSYHGLGDGPHAFSVRARDPSGNLSTPAAYGWSIDATAPETALASGPQPGTATSASFAFSASEPAVFECRLDGAAFALCGSPKGYDGLGVGEHRFEVRAIDSAGNVDATPVVHVWRISAVVPVVRTTSALHAPKAGAIVKKPPLLAWRRVSGASYYNVQVYRGRKKVLSAWPTRTRLKLRSQWKYLGRKQRLLPGAYRWYVWPGRGPASARRYGRLLGQSTFTVRR